MTAVLMIFKEIEFRWDRLARQGKVLSRCASNSYPDVLTYTNEIQGL